MTSTEAELGLDNDLNLGPNVRLLDFGKLVEGIAAGSLAVEYLVEAPSNGDGEGFAMLGCVETSQLPDRAQDLQSLVGGEGVLVHVSCDRSAEEWRDGVANLSRYLDLGSLKQIPVWERLQPCSLTREITLSSTGGGSSPFRV